MSCSIVDDGLSQKRSDAEGLGSGPAHCPAGGQTSCRPIPRGLLPPATFERPGSFTSPVSGEAMERARGSPPDQLASPALTLSISSGSGLEASTNSESAPLGHLSEHSSHPRHSSLI